LVPVAEIDWIEAQDYYVEVHCGGRGFLLRRPLKQLEERLDPKRFARVHRSVDGARSAIASGMCWRANVAWATTKPAEVNG
jgi:DNA-binding LytR/AlgR family response regulator